MTISSGEEASANDVLASVGNTTAQLAYEQVVSDATNWSNTDYLGADEFDDSDGSKDTVDTGTSTAIYETFSNSYFLAFTDEAGGDSTSDADSFTNPENAFDDNDATFASKTGVTADVSLGKTFGAKDVVGAYVKANLSSINSTTKAIILQTYNGSSWSTHTTLSSVAGVGDATFTGNVLIDASIQGIRIFFDKGTADNGDVATLYTLEYGDADTTAKTVETNSIISDIVPDSIVVYAKATFPANTSITVDVSDDGGSTFSLTGNSLNAAIDTRSFSTGNIALKFNLLTTDADVTPKLYGYGVSITD